MFSGRKIGTARRFGKTTFLIFCAVAALFAARSGGADTSSRTASLSKPISEAAPANPSDMLPKGRRAYSITLDNSNAALCASASGRRIDITAAFPAGPDGLPMAVTVLRGVPVIEAKAAAGNALLLLSVTPGDAERMAFAVANARIFVSLCPGGPDTATATQGVTFDDF